ncbi:cobamide remodeling phosphodiesterase CbiR [Pseudodesulfovibrio methanolicus]|uniref:Cobamide remodeling phosphodiesterase CbiR n=1 Tax=Pseudodesulfovibrio methanolicus TaxID=3126690 RepID=A0ABZ2IYE9_9BACT
MSTKPAGSPDRYGRDRENSAQSAPLSVREVEQKWDVRFPFPLAAPSAVLPAGLAENSAYLADYFPEIAVLFFETEACLAYTDEDLPAHLADLPCSWHVHMPLDLPWHAGFETAWQKIDGLLDKIAPVSPGAYVLHPPDAPDMLLPLAARLRDNGVDPALFLVENIGSCSLTPVWDEVVEGGFSACLDIGHIQAYDQRDVLRLPGLWERVRMLHVYGAERDMRHWPLRELDPVGQVLLKTMLERASNFTVTLEVFGRAELFDSLDLFGQLFARWEDEK